MSLFVSIHEPVTGRAGEFTIMQAAQTLGEAAPDRSLLLVDGDALAAARLSRSLKAGGFTPRKVATVKDALAAIDSAAPAFAIIELRLADGTGMQVVEALRKTRPDARMVILTAYGNVACAVAAVKAGVTDFIAKPADADAVIAALLATEAGSPVAPNPPMSAERARWEHIQWVHGQCGQNVSESARRLAMHRRTLQRILAKGEPR